MSESVYFIIFAVILLGLIPIVPKMVAFRARVLRYFRWNRLANWHERNTAIITISVRIIFAVLAVYLFILGLGK